MLGTSSIMANEVLVASIRHPIHLIESAKLGADEALALMVAQPLLIHRPLMEANGKLGSGFGSATDLGLLQTQDMPCVGPSGCAQHPDHQH